MNQNLIMNCITFSKNYLTKHPEYIKKGYLHFSFIVVDNKIIERGFNRSTNPPIHYGYPERSKLHSEIQAWIHARGLINGSKFEILNVRLNRTCQIRISKPCVYCFDLLSALGCKAFYYTTNEGTIECIN